MTKPKDIKNDQDPNKILVKCKATDEKEITSEECEYRNQKDKARERGFDKPPERSTSRDAASKLCIDCDFYPPFNRR